MVSGGVYNRINGQELTTIPTKALVIALVGYYMILTKCFNQSWFHFVKCEMERYIGMGEIIDSLCLRAYCKNDKENLGVAIRHLVDEAYEREIIPSFIDFHNVAGNELMLTLYGYPGSYL